MSRSSRWVQERMWLDADLASNKAMAQGTDLVWDEIKASSGGSGGISLDTATGVVTLPAGRTFMLTAYLYAASFSDSGLGKLIMTWVDENGVELVSNIDAVIYPTTRTNAHASQSTAVACVRTTAETRVKLRCVTATGTAVMEDLGTGLKVMEL